MNHSTKDESLQPYLEVASRSALKAGKLLLEGLQSEFQVSKKGRINLVTEMDVKAEKLIIAEISQSFPDHQILAEESGNRRVDSAYRWIIDPLDGTTNYAHGYRFFSVSIALEKDGEILVGVVFDPVTNEFFTATKGGGATLNKQAIQVSRESILEDSLVCTGFSYEEHQIQQNLRFFQTMLFATRGVRRDGSAALDLCYVASGRFDGFWELSLSPWDVAAGKLILEEAGGTTSRFDGSDCTIYDQELLATNSGIHAEMVRTLTSVRESSAPPLPG